jgi:NAD dependent epimerase/dehydratase family
MAEDAPSMGVVLVIGGTGVFGRLIVADLLTHTALSIAVASRHGIAPRSWLPGSEGRVSSHRLDARHEPAIRSAIERTQARVLVHAAGPYALIGDAPLRAALGTRIPYVDMCPRSDLFALLRDRYDPAARAAGLTCIVGASTAGGLTGLLTKRPTNVCARLTVSGRPYVSITSPGELASWATICSAPDAYFPMGRLGAVLNACAFRGWGAARCGSLIPLTMSTQSPTQYVMSPIAHIPQPHASTL